RILKVKIISFCAVADVSLKACLHSEFGVFGYQISLRTSDGSLTGANLFRQEWPGLVKDLLAAGRITPEKAQQCANIQRIIEAIDSVMSTAQSHQRCFVIEWPAPTDWPDVLCKKLQTMRAEGQRLNIIIVAEGAIDREGKAITAEIVRGVVKSTLHYDTRVTVLGHVQRGGSPSAFDRLLGCRMGAEAVLALMEMTPESEPCVVSIDGNLMVRVPLMQCSRRISKLSTKIPASMNAAVRSFVRMAIYHHCRVYGVQNSFEGLARGDLKEMEWSDVNNWVMHGGSFLGTQKQLPDKSMPEVAAVLAKFNIHAILLVGGFEAYHSCLLLSRARSIYPSLRIPMCIIPCTISNNIPGTSLSLGSDTAVNEICHMIDKIKQSATGTKRRVFIVETMGGYCGYLATLSALASGADNAYIFEEKFGVLDILEDVKVITKKMEMGVQRYLIVRCELANRNYTTEFVKQLFAEEGKGHAQQGGSPTPFDRNLGTKLAARALEYLVTQAKEAVNLKTGVASATNADTATLLGLRGRRVVFTPVEELALETDFEHRLPKEQWWLKVRPLLRILAKHDSIYEAESMAVPECEGEIN
uniref:6-phosphofructokinase n=1 Tax=Parascaris equorum TaxID=6256 RepID=A0A914RV31_PAREQ